MNPNRQPTLNRSDLAAVVTCTPFLPATHQAAIIVSMVFFGGCASLQKTTSQSSTPEAELVASHDELAERIDDFVDYFRATFERAATDIERKSSLKEHRRAAALGRVRMISECRSAASQPDPRESLLDLWVLCQRMLDYFTTGDGKSLFGPQQEIAREAAEEIRAAFERLAGQFILEDAFENLRARVVAYAREHPIRGEFAGRPAQNLSDRTEGMTLLDAVIGIPLAPFTALASAAQTPESIHNVSVSMDRFTDIVEDFPANARWQTQLLLMNLEEMPTVSDTVASLKQFSESSAQFTKIVEAMPQKLREETEQLLDRFEASHPELRTTLGETQKTVDLVKSTSHALKETAVEVQRTVSSVQESSAALEKAANAVTTTVKEIQKFIPASMKDESGQIIGRSKNRQAHANSSGETISSKQDTSFSFQAVAESANALGGTTEKLQILLADLRDFLDGKSLSGEMGALDQQFQHTMDATNMKLEGIVDHVTKRSAQLLLLLFALMMIYRFIHVKLQ